MSKRLPFRTICSVSLAAVCLVFPVFVHGQGYDLLLKGGHLIDARNGIDGPMDIAVVGDKIARVGHDLPTGDADRVVDVSGYYITPGLIDVHAHVFVGSRPRAFADGFSSVSPDDFSFRSGVTTIVDAGTSGWRNFPAFKQQVIDESRTRVLAFLNIAGYGMWDDDHNNDLSDMDPVATASMMKAYPEIIVGTKVGHFRGGTWDPFERAQEAAAGAPILVECHLPELPLEALMQRMRPGDLFTHTFGKVGDRDSVLDDEGRLKDIVLKAKDRGIVFDVGHGGGSFHFSQAVPALAQGLAPNTFGTDLHRGSMNDGMKDMLNIMSKYLNMGMALNDVVEGATWGAAKAIRRTDLGHLGEGAAADLTVLDVETGSFGFVDSGGYRMDGSQKLEAELTIRGGRIVWDLNGLSASKWNE